MQHGKYDKQVDEIVKQLTKIPQYYRLATVIGVLRITMKKKKERETFASEISDYELNGHNLITKTLTEFIDFTEECIKNNSVYTITQEFRDMLNNSFIKVINFNEDEEG